MFSAEQCRVFIYLAGDIQYCMTGSGELSIKLSAALVQAGNLSLFSWSVLASYSITSHIQTINKRPYNLTNSHSPFWDHRISSRCCCCWKCLAWARWKISGGTINLPLSKPAVRALIQHLSLLRLLQQRFLKFVLLMLLHHKQRCKSHCCLWNHWPFRISTPHSKHFSRKHFLVWCIYWAPCRNSPMLFGAVTSQIPFASQNLLFGEMVSCQNTRY